MKNKTDRELFKTSSHLPLSEERVQIGSPQVLGGPARKQSDFLLLAIELESKNTFKIR